MTGDVGQRLLDDPVDGGFDATGKTAFFQTSVFEIDGDFSSSGVTVDMLSEGGQQAEVIQHRRAEL